MCIQYRLIPLFILMALMVTACVPKMPEAMNMGAKSGDNTTSCIDIKEGKPKGEPVKKFNLVAKSVDLELDKGETQYDTWTFNGTTPGPEIRVQEGDRVIVNLTNQDIPDGVTIHWHGVVLPCSQDGVAGVTQNAVKPGKTYTYEFIAKHPGTFWYHSHQQSSIQVKKGLLGRFIVGPKKKEYDYDQDYAITLHKLMDGQYLVNQKKKPVHFDANPGEKVRLRIVNSTNLTQIMNLPVPFKVISIDGNNLVKPKTVEKKGVPIGAGGRYDLLFQMPVGKVQLSEKDDRFPLITFGIGKKLKSGKDNPVFDPFSYGASNEDGISIHSKFTNQKTLELDETLFGYTINGKMHHEIPPIIVKEGDLVNIHFKNVGDETHPMHLHGHFFKVIAKNGKPVESAIYMDTIPVNPGETYDIAFKANNPGLWMEHCHNLPHATSGMTMMVNYEGITTPYTIGTKSNNIPD